MPRSSSPRRSLERTSRSNSLPLEDSRLIDNKSNVSSVLEAKAAIAASREQPAVPRPPMPRSSSPRRSLERTSRSNSLSLGVPADPANVVEAKAAIATAREQPAVRRSPVPRPSSPRRRLETPRSNSLTPENIPSTVATVLEAKIAIAAVREQPAMQQPVIPRSGLPRRILASETPRSNSFPLENVLFKPPKGLTVVEVKAAIAATREQPAIARLTIPRSGSPRGLVKNGTPRSNSVPYADASSNRSNVAVFVETKTALAADREQTAGQQPDKPRWVSPRRHFGNDTPPSNCSELEGGSSKIPGVASVAEAKAAITAAREQPTVQRPGLSRLGESTTAGRLSLEEASCNCHLPKNLGEAKAAIAVAREETFVQRTKLHPPQRHRLGSGEKVLRSNSLPLETGVGGLKNVFEDEEVTAATGQRATPRRLETRKSHAPLRCMNALQDGTVSDPTSGGETKTAIAAVKQHPTDPRSAIFHSALRSNSLPSDSTRDSPTNTLIEPYLAESPIDRDVSYKFAQLQTIEPASLSMENSRGAEIYANTNTLTVLNGRFHAGATTETTHHQATPGTPVDLLVEDGRALGQANNEQPLDEEEHSFVDLENDMMNACGSLPGAFAVGTSDGSGTNLAFSNSSTTTTSHMDTQATTFRNNTYNFKSIDDQHEVQDTSKSGGHLAEAIAVEEVQEMPAAVEFDPDAKPLLAKRYAKVLLATICSVVVATTGGTLLSVFSPQPPDLLRRELIFDAIVSEDLDNRLNQSSDAFRKALEWIVDTDTLIPILPSNHIEITQRFVLAHLYFTTSIKGAWKTCSPSLESENDTCSDGISKRWLSGTVECLWAGVRCNSKGQVFAIICSEYGLTGAVPDSLFLLPHLQQLVLPNNELGGHIPKTLPSGLTMLSLRNNSITGPVSPAVTALSELRILDLSENALSGPVPSLLNELSSLSDIILRDNRLRGHVPTPLFELESLTQLNIGQNYISGTISTTIKLMSSLRILNIESNVLSGTIPLEIFEMSNLQRLQLGKNRLTGRLPSGLSGLPMVTVLDLKDNMLSGLLPIEMAVPDLLGELLLSGNRFVGAIPPVFCPPQKNSWVILQADCKPDEFGQAELQCSCCTTCCDTYGRQCEETAL